MKWLCLGMDGHDDAGNSIVIIIFCHLFVFTNWHLLPRILDLKASCYQKLNCIYHLLIFSELVKLYTINRNNYRWIQEIISKHDIPLLSIWSLWSKLIGIKFGSSWFCTVSHLYIADGTTACPGCRVHGRENVLPLCAVRVCGPTDVVPSSLSCLSLEVLERAVPKAFEAEHW